MNEKSFIIVVTNDSAIVPTKAYHNDVGFDLYALDDYVIRPFECEKINTGIRTIIVNGNFYMKIESRSSMAARGLIAVGGVIDPGYTGEIIVALRNVTNKELRVAKGDRIAQMIPQVYEKIEILHRSLEWYRQNIASTDYSDGSNGIRGSGGLGSSGTLKNLSSLA